MDDTRRRARQLVMMLREQSHDPDMDGEEALVGWYVEAHDHGDVELCKEMDSYDYSLLVELWNRPRSEVEE